MADLMPAVTELEIAQIAVGERLRPVDQAGVAALVMVIEDHGFTVPIIVRRKKSGFVLIDGAHRLAAMQQRGAVSIPVRAYTCTDVEARTMEAAQNLAGVSLTPLDDALFLAAYRTSYLEMHPETARGVAGGMARQGSANELSSFAELIANKRSMSVRQVQKLAKAGHQITREEASKLRISPNKVMLKDIIEFGKIPDGDVRKFVITCLSGGAAKSVSQARRAHAAEFGPVPEADIQGDNERAFKALLGAWKRAPMAVKRRFAREVFEEFDAAVTNPDEVM